jgi:hypothetical protein
MKHLIIIALLTITAVFTGCSTQGEVEQWEDEGRIVRIIEIGEHWDIYCDKSTNIAYLRYWAYKRAGLTPYLNSEGQPARCNEVHR